ncbi:hypothetical protein JKP88DRAFT_224937 [Tribonema minus]|uniref:Uncharacterized protein n=1 Tax=Tribonema minus TaxID=303371 RepID=A0A835YP79_9STRA|nr:hypothetical protein JKP88DRAFT_224937 [Tribonema minus]
MRRWLFSAAAAVAVQLVVYFVVVSAVAAADAVFLCVERCCEHGLLVVTVAAVPLFAGLRFRV